MQLILLFAHFFKFLYNLLIFTCSIFKIAFTTLARASNNAAMIGIMGAMTEEVDLIANSLTKREEIVMGGRTFHKGFIGKYQAVVVISHWGKVAAAITATTLILEFKITELLFTGVAGALHPDLQLGDVVIGKNFFQHDMDARPFIAQYEIPGHNTAFFTADTSRIETTYQRLKELLSPKQLSAFVSAKTLNTFNITQPKVIIGDIASADKFISSNAEREGIKAALPSICCVEMEGAAVAQVCTEYHLPFTVIRTISDTANDEAVENFNAFVEQVCSKYSSMLISLLFKN